MRLSITLVLACFLVIGCQEQVISPDTVSSSDPATGLSAAPQDGLSKTGAVLNFTAPMSGDQEVPAVDTRATGLARFQLSKDGTSLSYKLIVANIEDVLMAHIHVAPAGENGGVVVWLYPDSPPPALIPGRSDGPLADGVITADDLVGALAGQPLSALIEAMAAGNTYVNVHTTANPAGEIRGQIVHGNGVQ